jgi:ribosomal protein L32
VKEEEAIFDKVREYVRDNDNSTIKDVSDACDVSTKKILQYIRDGRLEAGNGMAGEVECSKCGKPITIGRMCEKCILETGFQVNDMREAARIKNKGKLFTEQIRKG